jgi:molecular chaperone HtpG
MLHQKLVIMSTGTINVQTENIFPIIKKFLYSDHEIFLRELISNAMDATHKVKVLNGLGEFEDEVGQLQVEVKIDKDAGTLSIIDRGIGMTEEEINKYINQIAFSGAEEFVNKYKDQSEGIIGHFGLGFYSAFMVSSKVEIKTLSHKKGSQAIKWECDGSPSFEITEIEKEQRGTEIVLHIADDSKEFLEEARISGILNKYCKFLPYPIFFGEEEVTIPAEKEGEEEKKEKKPKQVNNPEPLWAKAPNTLEEEDYKKFYQELYPFSQEPLFQIHLNVDYPFNLTGVLYFPKIGNSVQVQKNKIQLYSNQVFITDNVEEIVPDFLTLLHGVIDSPDIPLNVSRSYLQSDSNVKKISNHIMKKVADKLDEIYKSDKERFENIWDDLKVFMEYGMLSEEKFYDRAKKVYLTKDTDGNFQLLDDYVEATKELHKDKDDRQVILYTNDPETQYSYVQSAKDKGYKVLVLDSPLTPHFVAQLEQKLDNVSFARVDSDAIENLIKKDEDIPSKLSDEEKEEVKKLFSDKLDQSYQVEVASRSEKDKAVLITQAEFVRRMNEQQQLGGNSFMGAMPDMYQLTVNANHPVVSKLMEAKTDAKKSKLTAQLLDLALLEKGMLKGEKLDEFINRSVELIK